MNYAPRNSRFGSVRTTREVRSRIQLAPMLFAALFVAVVFGLSSLFSAVVAVIHQAH